MNFMSDTEAPAHPAVLEAVAAANQGVAASYGADEVSRRVEERLGEIFETDVSAILVGSGTAANALTLSVLCSSAGAILAHREAHIEKDERGAPGFFTGGAKLRLLGGDHGKIDLEELDAAIAANKPDFVHETPLEAISLTNLSEAGAALSVMETEARVSRAKAAGLMTHLDGARFGAAVAHLGTAPADLTWRAGVDAMSFGATKGGAMACEAIVLFGQARERLDRLKVHAKRSGHMNAKQRFQAAQLDALLTDGLWVDLAARANAQARRLAGVLAAIPSARLAHPVDGNEVFAVLPRARAQAFLDAGARFYPWSEVGSEIGSETGEEEKACYRFVCSWATEDGEIDALERLAGA